MTIQNNINEGIEHVCCNNRRVGLVYDDSFLLHKSRRSGHEERPSRLMSIVVLLKEKGLWNDLCQTQCRQATLDELKMVHTGSYLRKLERIEKIDDVQEKQSKCEDYCRDLVDVYMNEFSIGCAKLAAGSSIEAVNEVCAGRVNSSIAIVRPPGHHAEAHGAQGFCIYNNVAIAAKHAVDVLKLDRVMIVDWDVHHGNGSQRTFYDDPRVMYCSLHRYDYGKFFPCSEEADPSFVGEGTAAGTNINVAWNGTGHGDVEYAMAFEAVILPVGRAFKPQLVIISAGFDAAHGDAMGNMRVSPLGYAWMTRKLAALGNIVMILEGGYHLPSLAQSVCACTSELLNKTDPVLYEEFVGSLKTQEPKASALESIRETQLHLKPYYSLPHL